MDLIVNLFKDNLLSFWRGLRITIHIKNILHQKNNNHITHLFECVYTW